MGGWDAGKARRSKSAHSKIQPTVGMMMMMMIMKVQYGTVVIVGLVITLH